MKRAGRYSIALISALIPCLSVCQDKPSLDFSGQFSAVHVSGFSKPYQLYLGSRYIPKLEGSVPMKRGLTLEAEVSLNGSFQAQWKAGDTLTVDGRVKPYRIWIRMAGERYELRAGLQKINFGSATLLRPLMWFDQMDPRDPLQLTDGVYALLGRYFFSNNANLWLWGLWPGNNTKGWEMMRSDRQRPELGGRFQAPAGPGEIALSTHFRFIDSDQSGSILPVNQEKSLPEYRIGLDGKWDIGPGIWFEGSYVYSDLMPAGMRHQQMLTLGADYTLGWGNGLTCMFEHLLYNMGQGMLESDKSLNFTATSLTYPITMTHSLTAMVYFDWTNHEWYRFVNWGIRWSNIACYIIAFWNPERFELFQNRADSNLLGGKGVELMFVWNH